MKKILLLALLFPLTVNYAHSQDSIRVFLDKDRKKVDLMSSAFFYQDIFHKDSIWFVKEYYKNNAIKMIGSFIDCEFLKKDGRMMYYDEQGIIIKEENYSEGKQIERTIYYYTDGKPGIVVFYKKGGFLRSESYDKYGNRIEMKLIHTNASFPGGLENIGEFISKRLRYPKNARKQGLEGRLQVAFRIDPDGSINEIKPLVSKGEEVDPSLIEEAERIVRIMPNWEPQKVMGRAIATYFLLPFVFKLD